MGKLSTRQAGSVFTIALDDGKANVFQSEMIGAIDAALDAALQADAQAIVLEGRSGFFSGGLDLKTLPALSPADLRATLMSYAKLAVRLFLLERPVVAAITGHAYAGGAILALACDTRIGMPGTHRFGLNEVAIGLALPRFALVIAAETISRRALVPALLHGKTFAPDEALSLGFLQEIASDPRLRAAAVASELASLGMEAYAETKRRIRGTTGAAALEAWPGELEAFVGNLPQPASMR